MSFGDFAGRYVWHCHILEHEDNGRWRPFSKWSEPGPSADPWTRSFGHLGKANKEGHIVTKLIGIPIMLAIAVLPVYHSTGPRSESMPAGETSTRM